MWFRVLLVSCAFVLLTLLGWLASHTSLNPTIFGRYSSAYFTLLAGLATLLALSLLAHAPFLYGRIHRFRREAILMFSGLFASLMIVEVAIRSFNLLGISYLEE